jgi:hypothetical protein
LDLKQIWQFVERSSVIVGLLSFIPILWSWFILLSYRQRQKKILESIKTNPGKRPIALAIGVGNADISNQVRAHLETENMRMEIETLCFPALASATIDDFVQKLRTTRARLIERGVDTVHLFYMGPVAGALLVGDVFSNSRVQIYYHDRNTGRYECWGPLTHPMNY